MMEISRTIVDWKYAEFQSKLSCFSNSVYHRLADRVCSSTYLVNILLDVDLCVTKNRLNFDVEFWSMLYGNFILANLDIFFRQ